MRNLGNHNRWRSILQSSPVLFILFLVMLAFAWSVFGFWGKMSDTRENRKIIESKVVELRGEKERLSADISQLRTEEGTEDSIREKFGLAKEGEGLIIVVEDENDTGAEEEKDSNWFTSFFKNLFR